MAPDGQRIAFEVAGSTTDVWIHEIARGTFTRLTQSGRNGAPIWSPDSRRVAYNSVVDDKTALMVRPVDGSEGETSLWTNAKLRCVPYSWSPDGKTIAAGCSSDQTGTEDVYLIPIDKTSEPRPFINTPGPSYDVGPDGRFVLIEGPPEAPVTHLNVVLNWFDELNRLVPRAH